MDFSPFYTPVGVVGASIASVFLLKAYMGGGWYRGSERIPGKTVIITGANTGIGKETARELARRGGRVILACRDLVKAEAAREEIVQDTGNESVVCKHLDLASMASIRAFAKDINATEQHVHILINNAGIMFCPKMMTEDGFEMHIGVNHLGHFLLTILLLEKIRSSAPSRIINVASLAHICSHINFDDLNSEKSYSYVRAYQQSKLANILFTRELAKRLQNSGVTVNVLHPGTVNTELLRYSRFNSSVSRAVLAPVLWCLIKTPIQGAQTSLYCALSAQLEGVSGKYFSDCAEKNSSAASKNEETAKRLWDVSKKLTGLV